jgi:alpha(1,3/1,4) fucosyltransferase
MYNNMYTLNSSFNMKSKLKIDFTDFWPTLNKTDNYFFNFLSEKFDVEISNTPDILFFSSYRAEAKHTKYKCTKVFFGSENVRPPYDFCDFSFSFDYSKNKKNYRLPLYGLYGDPELLTRRNADVEKLFKEKTKFCCFVTSNPACEVRNSFFHQLNTIKKVDSGGKLFNNVGGPVADKNEFIKDYKFVLSFENSSYPGYTTEKIYEPLVQHCVPVYWGNPLVNQDFNENCFINCHNFKSFDDVIAYILEVENDEKLYKKYLSESAFTDDKVNDFVKKENIWKRMDEVIEHSKKPISFYSKNIRPSYIKIKLLSTSFKTRLIKKIKRSLS